MGSAAIYIKDSRNIRIIGGYSRGFDHSVLAENSDDLTIDSHQMFTKNGVDAKNCTNLNFNRNYHNPNINYATHYRASNGDEYSVVMFYANIYLKYHNYNPYI